jgi:tetratricopeptide (TPR) repeat protein
MEEQYFAGGIVFANMREEEVIGRQGDEVYRYPDILVLLTPSKVTNAIVARGAEFGIPVLHSTGLKDFAIALSKAKRGEPICYEGTCELLRSIIESRVAKSMEVNNNLRAARLSQSKGDWSGAEQYWRAYLASVERPNYQSEARLGLASAVAALGRYNEADQLFTAAMSDNPNYVGLAAGYAKSAYQKGDFKEALARWDRVINNFPESWAGYGGKVALLYEIGETKAALSLLKDESSLRRHNLDALHDLGRWSERLGNWREAECAWRSFIRLNNQRHWAFRDLARALVKQGRVQEAEKILSGARKRFPQEDELTIDAAALAENFR